MNINTYKKRRDKVRLLMSKNNIEALLVTLDANRFYLSGFELQDPQINESAGRLIISASGEDWLCTDSRYAEAAEKLWDKKCIAIYQGEPAEVINDLLKKIVKGKSVGFESANISYNFFINVSTGLNMRPADGLIEALRVIKDPDEITLLKDACKLNHELMNFIPSKLEPGRTESEIAWDIEYFFRTNGAESLSFASIVAVDANGALPHAIPGSSVILDNSTVLIDVGCRKNNYCSDQTRTFAVGSKPNSNFLFDLEKVKEAQSQAIKVIRPGISCSDVYKEAYKCLEGYGLEKLFTHGLGHGIGLQTHEMPSLSLRSQVNLTPGMVITVEPGVYRSGLYGIRWEYMILVTENGCEIL